MAWMANTTSHSLLVPYIPYNEMNTEDKLREALQRIYDSASDGNIRDSVNLHNIVQIAREALATPGEALNWKHPKYYPVKCRGCGWTGMSDKTNRGHPIADTGDFDDIRCPVCDSVHLDDLPEQQPPVADERAHDEDDEHDPKWEEESCHTCKCYPCDCGNPPETRIERMRFEEWWNEPGEYESIKEFCEAAWTARAALSQPCPDCAELEQIREYLWPNQDGLPNKHRNCLVAIKAREELARNLPPPQPQSAWVALANRLPEYRDVMQRALYCILRDCDSEWPGAQKCRELLRILEPLPLRPWPVNNP